MHCILDLVGYCQFVHVVFGPVNDVIHRTPANICIEVVCNEYSEMVDIIDLIGWLLLGNITRM